MTRVLDEGWLSAVLVTGVCGVVLLVVALLVAARLRVTEVTAVLQPVTRRLRRA